MSEQEERERFFQEKAIEVTKKIRGASYYGYVLNERSVNELLVFAYRQGMFEGEHKTTVSPLAELLGLAERL